MWVKTTLWTSRQKSSRTSDCVPHRSLLQQLKKRDSLRGYLRVRDHHQTLLQTRGGRSAFLSNYQHFTVVTLILTMRSVRVCFCLALLLPWCAQSQRSSPALAKLDEDTEGDVLAVDILNRSGVLNSLLRSEHHTVLRQARAPRPASQVPKRAQQGSRFALSLDVPTSILSVLIDLAKNQDMRTKAAANAELMARIGKRK